MLNTYSLTYLFVYRRERVWGEQRWLL